MFEGLAMTQLIRMAIITSLVLLAYCFMTTLAMAQGITTTVTPKITDTFNTINDNSLGILQKQADLNKKRLEAIESDVNEESDVKGLGIVENIIKGFIQIIEALSWPLLIGIIFWLLKEPIKAFLEKLEKANITVGGTKVSMETVDSTIVQREELIQMLEVALADDEPSKKELELIAKKARRMETTQNKIPIEDKKDGREILYSTIEVAIVDGEFTYDEWKTISSLRKKYGIEEDWLRDTIQNIEGSFILSDRVKDELKTD